METLLDVTVFGILENEQRIVEEDTFGFCLTDVTFVGTLAAVAIVPLKTCDLVHHVYDRYIQNAADAIPFLV